MNIFGLYALAANVHVCIFICDSHTHTQHNTTYRNWDAQEMCGDDRNSNDDTCVCVRVCVWYVVTWGPQKRALFDQIQYNMQAYPKGCGLCGN